MEAAPRPLAPAWARVFVAWTLRHARLIWIAALLLAVPAVFRTGSLYARLNTDIEALLPENAESVRAIHELRRRLRGIQHLGVLVDFGDGGDLAGAERLLDDLAARIRTYPPELVRSVRLGNEQERSFLRRNAPLYADLADLQTVRERVEARRDYEVAKAADLLLEDEGPPPLALDAIEKKYRDRAEDVSKRFAGGRFTSAEQGTTLLLVEVGDFTTGRNAATLLHRVQDDLRALGGPSRYGAGLRLGYTGDVATSVEETEALAEDLSVSSVIVLVAVFAVLVTYYRWIYSVVILVPPLLMAAAYAFALASVLPVGVTELNSNTAFLGSIIVGNGINYGIVLLARYVEERRIGRDVEDALAVSVWGAREGTFAAALAAGVAYASLCVTEFRGFRQFGVIGGIGMVLSWVCTFVLIPPLVSFVDRGKRRPARAPAEEAAWLGRVAEYVTAKKTPVLAFGMIVTLLAAAKVSTFGTDQIEYDLSRLRRADTWTRGEGYWGAKMNTLLGTYLTPTVILADDAEQARAIARSVRKAVERSPLRDMVATVRAVDDLVPGDQAAKLVEIERIRRAMTPRLRARIPDDKRKVVEELLDTGPLAPIGPDDLPPPLLLGLRERDGSVGRTVVVFPRPSRDLWVGTSIATYVGGLRDAARVEGTSGRVAGSLPLSADIFRSLRRDGPMATGLAFAGVAILVFALFRGGAVALVALGALLVGVLWLAGAAMTLGVRLNFTNFIAFPITFGIGVDYATNVMSRYIQEGSRDIARAVRYTGSAVAVCSATTVIGYSSLLLAQNRALYLFGLLAVLGELSCLVTAVIFLPSVVASIAARRRRTQAPVAAAVAPQVSGVPPNGSRGEPPAGE